MAWDPNEEGSYAWLSSLAHKHGGVKELISYIENNAVEKGIEQGKQKGLVKGATYVFPFALLLGTIIGNFVGPKIKEKILTISKAKKQQAENRKELQEKSDVAKEIIINKLKEENDNQSTNNEDNDITDNYDVGEQ